MRLSIKTLSGVVALGALGLLAMPHQAAGMEPPRPGDLEKFKQDGTLARRIEFARQVGNHKFDDALVQNFRYRLDKQAFEHGLLDAEPAPPSGRIAMPTKGDVKVLAIMIDFLDYPCGWIPAPAVPPYSCTSQAEFQAKLFGDGYPVGAPNPPWPYESLAAYYRRASYDNVAPTGGGLRLAGSAGGSLADGWYHKAANRTTIPQTVAGRQALIAEALNAIEAAGHDFAQYDNDGDGDIDYLIVYWSGPDTGWSTFWWGYATSWNNTTTPLTLDGKRVAKYSWQWEKNPSQGDTCSGTPCFRPRVVIHETGHALGLPDYYDYDPNLGPDGGGGGYDMMDSNVQDHNAFSKWMLEWISPTILNTGSTPVTLNASGLSRDAVAFGAGITNTPYQEFFLVQARAKGTSPNGNDSTSNPAPTGGGLQIWHVDGRLNVGGTNFAWDNSFTEHKQLRLMEADGLEEIEGNLDYMDADDHYVSGRSFTLLSYPPSLRYDNLGVGMQVVNVSVAGNPMTATIEAVAADVTAPASAPGTPTDEGSAKTGVSAIFTWTAVADPESGIAGYNLQVGTTPGGLDVFNGFVPWNGGLSKAVSASVNGATYYARVQAVNGDGLTSTWSGNSDGITVNWPTLDCNVVDNCSLSFGSPSEAPWYGQTTTTHDGVDAARAGTIANGATSAFQTQVTGPGTLTFWWKVSSEQNFDFLVLYLDATYPAFISGEVDWTQVTIEVPAGPHTLTWQYEKDESAAGGSDTAWVDQVGWTPSASGDPGSDFNANGKADIFWRNNTSGENAVWLMNGGAIEGGAVLPNVPSGWYVEGHGDFNADGKADVLFENYTTHELAIWFMDGTSIASSTMLPNSPATWHIDKNVGDFDGNGTEDLFFWKETDGSTAIWFITNGTVTSTAVLPAIGAAWELQWVADFNGDGKADVLFRNTTTGENALWLMNGSGIISGHVLTTVVTTWSIMGVGDFDGDGKADILWRGPSGEGAIWFMNGGTIVSGALLPTVASPWGPKAVGDFNGGGKADIWWRNTSTGENAIWFMNGSTIESSALPVTVAASWSIQAP